MPTISHRHGDDAPAPPCPSCGANMRQGDDGECPNCSPEDIQTEQMTLNRRPRQDRAAGRVRGNGTQGQPGLTSL